MRIPPLQFLEPDVPPDWVIVLQQSTDVLSVLIGLFIAYHAFRGYRRNDSRPMLFIAIGFLLVLAVPFILMLLYGVLSVVPLTATIVGTQLSQLSGLLAILYALRMPT